VKFKETFFSSKYSIYLVHLMLNRRNKFNQLSTMLRKVEQLWSLLIVWVRYVMQILLALCYTAN